MKETHVVYSLALVWRVVTGLSEHCPCGFGNICLGQYLEFQSLTCSVLDKTCNQISKGFFYSVMDCDTPANHCKDVVCANGECIPVFGSYYCDCPQGWYGQNCDIDDPKLESEGVKNPFYIYYQLQTGTGGERIPFYVVYDPGPQEGIMKINETGVKVEIRLSDGRHYFPLRRAQFKRFDVRGLCYHEAQIDPKAFDTRVCDLLPKGEHWAFKFDAKYSVFQGQLTLEESVAVVIKGITYVVGNVMDIDVTIKYLQGGIQKHILYNQKFRVLTYYLGRIINTCQKHVYFDGCSLKNINPVSYLRGQSVEIKTIVWMQLCQGTRNVATKWRLQSDAKHGGEYDPVPKDLSFGSATAIEFPPRFFTDGTHMIEVVVTVMGDPPHYGGTTLFEVIGRCFINIELGPMIVRAKGGNVVSMSCLYNLEIDLASHNPGMVLSEMIYYVRCRVMYPADAALDPECNERKTEVPKIRKLYTPCDTVYVFTVTAIHFISKRKEQNVTVIVHFIRNNVKLALSCLYNCYPIDTKSRAVIIATTEPYVPASIQWEVTSGLKTLDASDFDLWIPAFMPLVSTRVLRIDGSALAHPHESLSQITVSASVVGLPELKTTMETVAVNIAAELAKFVLTYTPQDTVVVRMVEGAEPLHFEYEPVVYQLFQDNDIMGDSILLDAKYDYRLLNGRATIHHPLMKLCIKDAMRTKDCTRAKEFRSLSFSTVTASEIIFEHAIGADRSVLVQMGSYMNLQLRDVRNASFLVNITADIVLAWKKGDIYLQRGWLLDIMVTIKNYREREVQAILYILTMVFFSTEGNEVEGLVPFVDPMDIKGFIVITRKHYRAWIDCRVSAIGILHRATEWAWENGQDVRHGVPKLLPYDYGDILNGIIKCWNMAHLQSIFATRVSGNLKERNAHDEVLDAQFHIINADNEKRLIRTLSLLVKTEYLYSHLYFGIRVLGINHSLIWSTRTSYQGILDAFNQNHTGENLTGYSNYIFGPPCRDVLGFLPLENWMTYAKLGLPKLEKVGDLAGRELFFVVGLVGNKEYDTSISPTLIIHMNGPLIGPLEELPGGAEFNVTLPILIEGKQKNLSNAQLYEDSIKRPSNDADKYKYYTVYKVVLPNEFKLWDLGIYTKTATPLKVQVNLHSLPEYEEVVLLEPPTPTFYEIGSVYVTKQMVVPDDQSTILPRYFYVGILLDENTPVDIWVPMYVRNTVDVCWMHPLREEGSEVPCKGKQLGVSLTIDCVCDKLGYIEARTNPIRFTKLLMTPIKLTVKSSLSPVQLTLPFFLAGLIIVMIIIAVFIDRYRKKKEALILMEDCRLLDTCPLILGVFTSPNLMAGTRSTVGIKVEGRSSSSRVHLLKCKSRTVLQRACDDWFLLTTNQPLGKIQRIILWHDYRCHSNWYCHYILIFDIKQDEWYMANVNRWFRLQKIVDESRFAIVRTFKFGNLENGLKAMPGNLKYHVISEIRNSHYFISMFTLHPRSMYSIENRTLTFLLKLLGRFFGAWLCQLTSLFHPENQEENILEPSFNDIHFDEYTILIAIIVDAVSYIFMIPYLLLVRLLAGSLFVLGLAFIISVEEFTKFGAKYNVTLFYVGVVLFFDFVLFNPIIMALKTFVMFVYLQTSNREYHLWCETSKPQMPKPLSFKDYVRTATGKAYKPLLSTEIEKITKASTIYHAIRICVLYTFVLICIALLVVILVTRHDKGYYTTVRTIKATSEQKRISTGIRRADVVWTSILDVNRPKTVEEFIPSTFGELQLTWPNGKRMDDLSQRERWFLDRASKIIGPASILITCISTSKQLKTPGYFTQFFSNAYGFLDDSGTDGSPIVLADWELNYTRLETFYHLQGKSGQEYHMVGNHAIIPTDQWKDYYISLSTIFEDLNQREDLVPRVVIISYNIVTANTLRLSAVDLVIEYLPSGECSALLHVASSKVKNPNTSKFVLGRMVVAVLALAHLVISVVDISTLGFKNYITHWYGVTKVVLSATGLIVCATTVWCFIPKFKTMDVLFNLPSDKYLDLHQLLNCELADSSALSLLLLVLCIDVAVAVKDALGLRVISQVSTNGVRMSISMLLVIMIYGKVAAVSTGLFSRSYDFMIGFFFRSIFPLGVQDEETEAFLIVGITILCIFSKFCLAIYVYHFEVFDENYVSEYHPGRSAAVLSKLKPLRDASKVKMQYVKKHSVYVGKPFDIQSSTKSEELRARRKWSSRLSRDRASRRSTKQQTPKTSPIPEGDKKVEARNSKLGEKWFFWW